jgi:hypothetical protein
MGPDLGLAVLMPALLFSLVSVLLSARQEQAEQSARFRR